MVLQPTETLLKLQRKQRKLRAVVYLLVAFVVAIAVMGYITEKSTFMFLSVAFVIGTIPVAFVIAGVNKQIKKEKKHMREEAEAMAEYEEQQAKKSAQPEQSDSTGSTKPEE